jgi:hypothetical protein
MNKKDGCSESAGHVAYGGKQLGIERAGDRRDLSDSGQYLWQGPVSYSPFNNAHDVL